MFRLLKILFFSAFLAGTFFWFRMNTADITIYFFREKGITGEGYIVIVSLIMIGMVIGYIVSLKSVISYRSEISGLVKKNKEVSDELDSLRNVAIGEEFNFTDKE